MLVKQRFYYRARDSAQDGVLGEDCDEPSACIVRSDRTFNPQRILCQERAYFGMMKKESGEQRESTFTNSAVILRNITLLDPRTVRIAKESRSYCHTCIKLVKSVRFVFFQLNLLFELDSNGA